MYAFNDRSKDGQPATCRTSTHKLSLGFLAEVILATQEEWGTLPDPYPLFGNEFLEGVLEKAGDG